MGKHISWRPPNDQEPASYGEPTKFGGRSDGGQGYLAHSQRVGPGVVLVHDAPGLTGAMRGIADTLCHAGFTVLAPDLYDGIVPMGLLATRDQVDALDKELILPRLSAAVGSLRENWHPRVGAVGFGMGGVLVAELAVTETLDALVVYGVQHISGLDVPLLLHEAHDDDTLEETADFLLHHLA